ncbi:hypothetical protein pipiens_014720 [Culex pipiens pipiens]|uniref:F-box domain-containing protein n=1 Tax=Culex pipiens pipiens TaxID=38569 RepID=A0ABD1CTL8_CULPP
MATTGQSQSIHEESTINEILPSEMLEHVFGFLPLHDRKSVSLVCRSWCALAFSRRFMRHVTLRLVDWENFRASKYDVLRSSARRYRHIMAFFGPKECPEAQFELLLNLVDRFGRELDSLFCLTMFKANQLQQIVEKTPNVQQLVVGLSSVEGNSERSFPVLRRLKDLGSLNHMLQCPALDVPRFAPNLEQLTVNFTSSENIGQSIEALKKFGPQLKSLEMFASDYYFEINELRFPKLRVLKLSGKIVDASVTAQKNFFKQFTNLREASFDCNIQDVVLDTLTRLLGISGKLNSNLLTDCKPLPTVETFHLHMYESDNDQAIFQRFTQLLPNTKQLKITFDEKFTIRNTLLSACKPFAKLQRLEIADRSYRMANAEPSADNALQELKQLDELVLNSLDVPVAYLHPSGTLKRLRLKFVVGMTDRELLDVVRKFPNLRYLEVACCRRITDEGIRAVRDIVPSCVVHHFM